MLSLYLHFPFCKRKCFYCDFCSAAAGQEEIDAYCASLEREIILTAEPYAHMPVDTVFLGGGTPSMVPATRMTSVLATLHKHFSIMDNAEFTSEANPGTLTDEWLEALTVAGMNRLSLGVQAKQQNLLSLLGRVHDFPQAMDALTMARKHGLTNINADVMFGLPEQTLGEYFDTLRALAEAGTTHISAYALQLEDGTPLAAQVASGTLAMPSEDVTADMLEGGVSLLNALGYARYEISNFAKEGYQSRHNIGYWTQKHYLGLGVSAASHLPASADATTVAYVRRQNTHSVKQYIVALSEERLPLAEEKPISTTEAMFETVMLGLRMVEGVRYGDFAALHGQSLTAVYGDAIEKLTREGLLAQPCNTDPRLFLTPRGLALQNTALMAFLRER